MRTLSSNELVSVYGGTLKWSWGKKGGDKGTKGKGTNGKGTNGKGTNGKGKKGC